MASPLPAADAPVRLRLLERYRRLDGQILRLLTWASLHWLRTNQQVVNALNVFPIPDGDTGTNMVLTMQAAWDEVSSTSDPSVSAVAHALAHGALMGARGNSGVILSQLWRGFARSMDKKTEIDPTALAEALAEARDTAYRGVVRPVEGTILTVSSDVAEAARLAIEAGVSSGLEVLERVVQAAEESVARTPELLPVLKEAGVVDSGGKGLYFILEGMLRAAYRLPLNESLIDIKSLAALETADLAEKIEPGQDWEVVVDFRPQSPLDLPVFHRDLQGMGTSIQIAEGDGRYRMHIHVPDHTEFAPVEYLRRLGTVIEYRVENLMIQSGGAAPEAPVALPTVTADQVGVVAVSSGHGLSRLFASLGVAAIVEGGQTMNPSAQDICRAVEGLPSHQVIVLPNNKNIILAANQAAELTGKQVRVIATTSIPQGLAAMLPYGAQSDLESLAGEMERARLGVRTGELTTATRSVEIDGVAVREGQVIGMIDGKLVVAGDTLEKTLLELLQAGGAAQADLVTAYIGKDLPESIADQVIARIRETYPSLEVESYSGGQPHYPLLLSIE
jgi:DAK2 domain fusion protein YloV